MNHGSAPDPEAPCGMASDLQNLAADIASLSSVLAKAEGTDAALLIRQLLCHLQWVLEQLMDQPGMLVAPAPWWADWQNNAPTR
jgi:hypothetical protein